MRSFDAAMRALLRIVIVITLLISTAVFAAQAPFFEQANAKYKEGDFKGALETYQKLLQTGQSTAAVYYNIGNAALKTGEKGQALVYYERARKASPRDADLQWNIGVLKDALRDKVEDRSHFVIVAVRALVDRWTVSELAFCFTAFLALAAFLSMMGGFFVRFSIRAFWLPLVLTLLVSGALLTLKAWDTKDLRAVVLDKETSAFYGPSDRETKAFVLHEGAEGRVLDESSDWIYLFLQNKNAGWVRKNSCEIV